MRLAKLLIVAPVAAVILAFAFANRDWVTINFDPVGGHGLEPVQVRQYVVMLVAAGLGVVAGSAATWIGQGWRRRAQREAEIEAARLRQELQAQRLPPVLSRQA
jgi:hypothetical protein